VTESLPPEDPRDALTRELTARVSELTAQVAELREQPGAARRAASRNSGNSSLPPSGDDQPRRQPRRERRAAERAEKKRSRGKQPGSPGAAMRWRKPAETLDHHPQGACACGLDLAGAADLGVARSYQQEDVPEPQPSRRYQHDLHKARCACGRVHVAERPDVRLARQQPPERGVRPLKTQQKISGRLTSDDVTQNRLDIRGYIDTARKHGLGALDVLEQLMLGRPWMPPAQPISP
jgi:hypothetical protein